MSTQEKAINTVRLLSADMIEKSNSGHPGLPLGFAPAAFTLWANHMNHNPQNPNWSGRDRFVLSAGHGSTLIYSLLHLFNYGLSLDDLKNFRQMGSKTPGHPEYGHTIGVEVTTGPLGQGIANGIGMAMAEAHMAATFNKPNHKIVDNYTFIISGDGCLQEGISSEASSLAGSLGLGKVILLYDSNNITIEGDTATTFNEDVKKRYEAYGWQTLFVADGNDIAAIDKAINEAKADTTRPSLIEIKTKIGYGSPKAGTSKVHGEPLGKEALASTKAYFGFNPDESFVVPDDVKAFISEINKKQAEKNANYVSQLDAYKKEYPAEFALWETYNKNEVPDLLNNDDFWTYTDSLATRLSSEIVLNKVADLMPNLIGGSADLSPSTKTIMKNRESFVKGNEKGSNLHFGVREHAMSAMANGMYLYGGLRPYTSGFFVFSDYAKPALRISSLMNIPVINIFTHDSIGVGEDGPTHQPIEQLASLRSIPGFTVLRPCDTKEVAAAWYTALVGHGPSAIILTRQTTPLLAETGKNALKGAYILRDSDNPEVILIATGSEVELIYKAYDVLKEKGVNARVVSMISMELFDKQDESYKASVLPKSIRARVGVEAASPFGWGKYLGLDGVMIAMEGFGDSGPADQVFLKHNFTVENVVNKALSVLNK